MKLDDYKAYPQIPHDDISQVVESMYYDGPLWGICTYKGETHYFHCCDMLPEDRSWYRRFMVFDLRQDPEIKLAEELDQYVAIGWFED